MFTFETFFFCWSRIPKPKFDRGLLGSIFLSNERLNDKNMFKQPFENVVKFKQASIFECYFDALLVNPTKARKKNQQQKILNWYILKTDKNLVSLYKRNFKRRVINISRANLKNNV